MAASTPIRAPANDAGRRRNVLLVCLFLVVATVGVYWQVAGNGFVNFDDPDYVSANPRVQSGLNSESVRWAFTALYSSNWHPVTWLSHMLDSQIYGAKPAGHHVTNLIFHTLNSLLLFGLLLRMTGALWRSAMVAALFALHPLHVESVAWVSERKDVLCTCFGLLCLWAYVRYAQAGNRPARSLGWYLLSLLFLALGLMSKPMLVTLPCLLLLLDYWPLGRIRLPRLSAPVNADFRPVGMGRLVAEKIPFFVLSATSSVVTFLVQKACGAMVPLAAAPLDARIANAFAGYGTYLMKTFWPSGLAVFYPLTPADWGSAGTLGALLVILGVTVAVVYFARSRPYLLVGWLWFLGTLVPVIGFVQVGRQGMADRYTYLPHVGLFIMVVWAAAEAARHLRAPRAVTFGVAGVLLAALGVVTSRQVAYWRSSITLFEHALAVTTGNYVAYGVLSNALVDQGKLDEAIEMCQKALALAPQYPEGFNTLGNIHYRQQKYEEAIENYRLAAQYDPLYADPLAGMGSAYLKVNKFAEAEAASRKALELAPLHLTAMFSLASALHNQGKLDEAATWYRKILMLQPELVTPRRLLGNVLVAQNKPDEAIQQFRMALKIRPEDPDTHVLLGVAEMQKGDVEVATKEFLEGVNLQPTNAIANYQLGTIFQMQKRPVAAVDYYRKALQAQPNWVEVLNNLAWILAASPDPTARNGKEAVERAERACVLTHFNEPLLIGTLAAAYAEAGRFTDAVQAAEKARDTATTAGMKEVAAKNAELLELYRAGKAYHEPQ